MMNKKLEDIKQKLRYVIICIGEALDELDKLEDKKDGEKIEV